MKNRERYQEIENIVANLQDLTDDMISKAEDIEIEGYIDLSQRAREIAGQIESLAHDLFQANLKDNA